MELNIQVRVARHPVRDDRAFSEFRIALEGRMSVPDTLFRIHCEIDGPLEFRCSCRVVMRDTRAVYVNRIPRLAWAALCPATGLLISLAGTKA